jgi:septal ring-binding cell division protein DamX
MGYNQYTVFRSTLQRALIALLLCLIFATTAFADREQALQAQARGDYNNAAKMWLQLANDGDPLAEFNLALLYERGAGVIEDNNLYHYWLQMAARKGLVEAYTSINAQGMKPTSAPASVKITMGPQQWVAAQNPKYYTLQLASSTNQALIQKYYSESNLAGKAGYYRSRRSGEDWFALVYGAYPTVQDAKAAIDDLPADLKKWSPWVRNIKSILKIMVR